ncbi:Hypothetical predicted protein [Paramuricea clavata]|uniref:Uncharacterized protein n=1 Tax=Paramuricea clavata TaxID=317549 RepID=A0A7D9KMD9_PARCT|nr:Hypothetical predicted protein [Paramuricea clavata]
MSDTIQNKPVSQGSAWDTDWNDMKDSFVQDDNWTQSFFQQETKTNMEKSTTKFGSSPKTSKKSTNQTEDAKKGKTAAKTRPKQGRPTTNKTSHSSDGWGEDDWAPLEDSAQVATSLSSVSPADMGNAGTAGDSWDTEGWDNFDSIEDSKQSNADIARKKREERKKQRQQALKEKRAAKGGSKLGAVKKDQF